MKHTYKKRQGLLSLKQDLVENAVKCMKSSPSSDRVSQFIIKIYLILFYIKLSINICYCQWIKEGKWIQIQNDDLKGAENIIYLIYIKLIVDQTEAAITGLAWASNNIFNLILVLFRLYLFLFYKKCFITILIKICFLSHVLICVLPAFILRFLLNNSDISSCRSVSLVS